MSRDREYNQAHNKGMSTDQRRKWVRDQASKEDSKNLPFTFSKPPRRRGRTWDVQCVECGTSISINRTTIIGVCPHCKFFNRYKDGEPVAEIEEKDGDDG